ncbi:glycosyltransferase family 2 protein [Pelistega sp. MC2]|uniref:glycosyltransferase family 2 protein n=1 Tax=Pelistega sp. MC2 TaxID=1720297 RepID=UPI0008DAE626|nr:glycosyltransferase family 2 protein [Pelistega sp. MC2]
MTRYSIIVPVYNVENYLIECLESINSAISTKDCCECIIINDGSTDNSKFLAEQFCQKHKNFKLYNQPNKGLSEARNYGLSLSQGEYIIFVDSDDVINPILIESLNQILTTRKADLIYIPFIKFHLDETYKNLFVNHPTNSSAHSFKLINKRTLAKEPNFAWARIAKRELYSNNQFPPNVIYEDLVTSPVLTQQAQTIAHITTPMYGYRKRKHSITSGSAEKQFKLFEAVEILQHRQEQGLVDKKLVNSALVNLIQSCLVSLVRIPKQKRATYRKIILQQYQKLNNSEILGSHSYWKFKILSVLARYPISLLILEKLLSPIVAINDKKYGFAN